jgi:hypothetical protein
MTELTSTTVALYVATPDGAQLFYFWKAHQEGLVTSHVRIDRGSWRKGTKRKDSATLVVYLNRSSDMGQDFLSELV